VVRSKETKILTRANTKTKTPSKTLELDIALFRALSRHLRPGDRDAKLVIRDDNGRVDGKPSKDQVWEFSQFGTIDGRHDLVIGIRYTDRRGSKVTISLTRKQAAAFLPLMS